MRHLLIPGALFVVLSVLGELVVASVDVYPLNPGMAHEAVVSDDALRLLFSLAVPVGAFTLAALLYGIWTFRRRGEPGEDGPPIRGGRAVTGLWLAVTGALTLVVIINPGLSGLAAMAQSGDADLVVGVSAQRWSFAVWIPAFRIKKDAVPGLTTVLYVTPTQLGTYESNVNLRVQCTQLCGLAHSTMSMPVRVVTEAEFQSWLARNRG